MSTGTKTLQDLNDGVREHLASWPVNAFLKIPIDKRTSTLRLTSRLADEYVSPGSLIEVGDEIMRVVDRPDESNTIRVMRGFQNTIPVPHKMNDRVLLHSTWGWTDRTLNSRHIATATRWLRPDAWTQQVSPDFTWSSDSYFAQVPTSTGINNPGGNKIFKMEALQASSTTEYLPFYGWQLDGTYLRFKGKASTDTTIHAIYGRQQPVLLSPSDILDDDDFAEAIETYAAHLALNSLKSNRVRFTEYSASLNDRASTVDELIRQSFDLKNQAVLARENFARLSPPTFLSTYRDP